MAKRSRCSRSESESRWRRLIREQQQSGQTIVGFCRDHELTESAFHFWKRELRGRQAERDLDVGRSQPADNQRACDAATRTFVPVSVSHPLTSPITLELNGATLRIEAGVDGELLRTVLDALRAG